jgi:hypothetical protein
MIVNQALVSGLPRASSDDGRGIKRAVV